MLCVNFVLMILWVKMASQAVNLDAMHPFYIYEVEENSTKSAAAGGGEGKEALLLWELALAGVLFWDVSTVMAILLFSKAMFFLQGSQPHLSRNFKSIRH